MRYLDMSNHAVLRVPKAAWKFLTTDVYMRSDLTWWAFPSGLRSGR